jgi:predicted ATP-dependent endonuclease of OLD family
MKRDFTDNHVSVINLGGRYYSHFLKLFDIKSNENAIEKKIACITDIDPVRTEREQSKTNKCYPFELEVESQKYMYNACSNPLIDMFSDPLYSVRTFSQSTGEGKTFEYEIVLFNPGSEVLVTDSMSNREEIVEMMNIYNNGGKLDVVISKMRKSEENDRIKLGILSNESWGNEKLIKHTIASRYLNSISKGENAQELAFILEQKLDDHLKGKFAFTVPDYIKEAIEWICPK